MKNDLLFKILYYYINIWEGLGKDFYKLINNKSIKNDNKKENSYNNLLNNSLKDINKKYIYESIKEFDRYLIINDKYYRIYYLASLPSFISFINIYKLISLPFPLVFSYHIEDTNKSSMIRSLRNRLSVLESERNSLIKKGKNIDPELIKQIEELNIFINDIVYDKEKTFLLSFYVLISSNSKKQLIDYSNKLQDASLDIEFTLNTYSFEQKKAYESILPFSNNTINEKHLLQTSALVNLLPFLSRNLNDPSGIFFGINHFNNGLILIDLFKARNANVNIFGTSGSGKSVTAKLIITRLTLRGVQNIIIDPEGEYSNLVESLNGCVYRFNKNSGIDPIKILLNTSNNSNDYIQILKQFFNYYIQDKNKDTSLIDSLLVDYFNINSKTYSLKTFISFIKKKLGVNAGIYLDLNQLIKGSLSWLFNSNSIINFNSNIISFDLSSINTDEEKIPIMYLIGNVINRIINDSSKRRMIIIDEAHKFIKDNTTSNFYIDLVKTARKRKAGVITITQNPEDFKELNNTKTIITQAETTILLKQSSASVNYIKRYELFKLSEKELTDISTLNIGEALFIREKEHIFMNIFPFNSEKEIVF